MKKVVVRRWEIAVAFLINVAAIVVVTVLLTHQINVNDIALNELQKDKASITQLERTDCKLRSFMISAARSRRRTAALDTDPKKKKIDEQATKSYQLLADSLKNERCAG